MRLVRKSCSRNSVSAARRLKGAGRWDLVSSRQQHPGLGSAGMPRYAQLVMGPAGSGKVSIWREKKRKVRARGRQGGSGPDGGTGACVYRGPWAARLCGLCFSALFVVVLKVE